MTLISHEISTCFDTTIEANTAINSVIFSDVVEKCNLAISELKEKINAGDLPLLAMKNDEKTVTEIESIATHIRNNFKHLFVLGTGGSTLCGQIYMDLVDQSQPCSTQIHFLDNIDPDIVVSHLKSVDLSTAHFLVISKSGSTMETLGQFFTALSFMKETVDENRLSTHFSCISDNIPNVLREIAEDHKFPVYEHVRKIGGRFSLVTNVGLIPAAVAGINIRRILEGCNTAITDNLKTNSNAIKGASLHFCAMEKGLNTNVFMPYCDRLKGFGTWYRQIWAESLGKEGMGTTPINAHGTLDQHSQLQLYLDGPKDKFYTFLFVERFNYDHAIDNTYLKNKTLNYLKNNRLSDLFNASAKATCDTVISNNNPVRTITIDTLDEHTLGQLIMHFIFETVYMAHLMRIDPFDQPAVEEGKIRAREILTTD